MKQKSSHSKPTILSQTDGICQNTSQVRPCCATSNRLHQKVKGIHSTDADRTDPHPPAVL